MTFLIIACSVRGWTYSDVQWAADALHQHEIGLVLMLKLIFVRFIESTFSMNQTLDDAGIDAAELAIRG